MLTGACDNPRRQPQRKTPQCPERFTRCNGLLGSPATSQAGTERTLTLCSGLNDDTDSAHGARGAAVLPPPQQSSPEPPRLPGSLLPEQGTHIRNVEETKPATAASKLTTRQPQASCGLG